MQDGNRPLTARSVLASALLGEDPPELPVAHLVHLAGLFGINENRARVALSRMVVDRRGDHRRVRSVPAGRPPARPSGPPGREPAGGDRGRGTGAWRMAVVTGHRAGRPRSGPARRKRLALARLAELREGVWLRPDNIDLVPDPADDPDLAMFTAVPDGDPVALAAGLWDLDGWARAAGRLLERLGAAAADRPRRPGPRLRAVGRRCSATCRPTRSSRPSSCPAGWPGPGVAPGLRPVGPAATGEVLATWGRGGAPAAGLTSARPVGRPAVVGSTPLESAGPAPGRPNRPQRRSDEPSKPTARRPGHGPFAGRVAVDHRGGPGPGPEPRPGVGPAGRRHRHLRPLPRPGQCRLPAGHPRRPGRDGATGRGSRGAAVCRRWPT